MTTISDDTFICLNLVARYVDIVTQLHIYAIIKQNHGALLEFTFHNDPWDLQHVTEATLELAICLVGCVDVPPSQLTTLDDPDDLYAMLFGDMAKCRNVVAASYALKHCERLCNNAMLLTIMQVIGHEAVATGDAALFETLFVPNTYLNKLATSDWHDDIYDLLTDLIEEAAFRGYPDIFRVLDHVDIPHMITFVRHPHDGYYDARLVHRGVLEKSFWFHGVDAWQIAIALLGGHEAMIAYAMDHSEQDMCEIAPRLKAHVPIPDAWRLPPAPIHMEDDDE